jgi:hypothetical protein
MEKDTLREDTRRSFSFDEKEYFINTPTSEVIRKADWHYSKIYNEAMAGGILTQSEMEEILRVRGMLGDDYKSEMSKVTAELEDKIVELEIARATNADDTLIKDLAVSVGRIRARLFELNQRLNRPMSNTCEGRAEDERVDFLVSNMLEYKDGSKVWPGDSRKNQTPYEQYIAENNRQLTLKAKYEVMLWMQGLDSDFFSKTPETLALKELEDKNTALLAEAMKRLKKADDEVKAETEELNTELVSPSVKEDKGKKIKKAKSATEG